jgi:hypothetical protein
MVGAFANAGEVRAVASCFSPCATAAVSSHPLVVVTLLLPHHVRRRELGTLVHNVKVKGDMMEKAPQHHHNGSGDGVGVAQLLQFLDSLKNYEREGVPQGAGTDSDAGFDLQRMHRLLLHLGNPLSCYSVCAFIPPHPNALSLPFSFSNLKETFGGQNIKPQMCCHR